jgi:CHAT domain
MNDPGAGVTVAASPSDIALELVWGDVTRVEADFVAVGHYKGMKPAGSELALDHAISGPDRPLVLTEHTRRGLLTGDFGDIKLFPWRQAGVPERVAAVAGMGYPATFGETELRRLASDLAWVAAGLPDVATMATVLIGSGSGNMRPSEAVEAFAHGLADACRDGRAGGHVLQSVRIVEWQFDRALDALDLLVAICGEPIDGVTFAMRPDLVRCEGGGTSDGFSLALALAAAARAVPRADARPALDALLADLPERDGLRDAARAALEKLAASGDTGADSIALARTVAVDPAARDERTAMTSTRVSFITEDGKVTASAITDSATVPERLVGVDLALVREAATRMARPRTEDLASLASFMGQLVVPRDFRSLLRSAPRLVFEVDRTMATVHWEMLSADVAASSSSTALGLAVQVARQLRTTYSPSSVRELTPGERLRALVVGDPGDPATGQALEGARKEAELVANLFRELGLDVVDLIGPPGHSPTAQPASRLEVLRQLTAGSFDLLHYAGHSAFDMADPSKRAGWIFADGLLTSQELEIIDHPPRLVVANACHSSQVSEAAVDTTTEVGLLPSLADEFVRRGVRDYVGTAWAIGDAGSAEFASTFYGQLLVPPEAGAPGATIGEAMLAARRRLAELGGEIVSWGAYQHYGDPTVRFVAV